MAELGEGRPPGGGNEEDNDNQPAVQEDFGSPTRSAEPVGNRANSTGQTPTRTKSTRELPPTPGRVEPSRTDEKTVSNGENPKSKRAQKSSQIFVEDRRKQFERQDDETKNKGDKDGPTDKTQGHHEKKEMASMEERSLNKTEENYDTTKKLAPGTDSLGKSLSESFEVIHKSDVEADMASGEGNHSDCSNRPAVPQPDLEEGDTQEHKAGMTNPGNGKENYGTAETQEDDKVGRKNKNLNVKQGLGKPEGKPPAEETRKSDKKAKDGSVECSATEEPVERNLSKTPEENIEENHSKQCDGCHGGIPNAGMNTDDQGFQEEDRRNTFCNDLSVSEPDVVNTDNADVEEFSGSSSSSSIEKLSENETENNDPNESVSLEFQMSSLTHLPGAAEKKQRTGSEVATSLNQSEETPDNLSSETTGEPNIPEDQDEEQSESDCNGSEKEDSNGQDNSPESFTSSLPEYSPADTHHSDGVAEGHVSSQLQSAGQEMGEHAQCLENKKKDKKVKKVRATVPQSEDLGSPTSETVRPREKGKNDEASVDDITNTLDRMNINDPESEHNPILPSSSCESDGKAVHTTVTRQPVPSPRSSLKQAKDEKEDSKQRSPSPSPGQSTNNNLDTNLGREERAQDIREDCQRRSPSPSPRMKNKNNNMDSYLDSQKKGGTEDLVKMPPEKNEESNKITLKPDGVGKTMQNVPGGTEDLVKMPPEKTEESNKITSKPDGVGKTMQNVPGEKNLKDKPPTPPPRGKHEKSREQIKHTEPISETGAQNEQGSNFSGNSPSVIQSKSKGVTCKTVKKPAVFLKQMEQQAFKEYWNKTYPSVEIKGNAGSDDIVEITLQSPDDIEDASKGIYDYPCNVISFGDVKHCEHVDKQIRIHMLHDAICSIIENEKDVVYDIHEKTGRIGVCSSNRGTADILIQKIKKCIKLKKIERGESDQPFDDQLVQSLNDSFVESGKQYVSVVLKSRNTLDMFAPKNRLEEYNKEVKAWLCDKNKLDIHNRCFQKETVEEKTGCSISGTKDEVQAFADEENMTSGNAKIFHIEFEIGKKHVSSFSESLELLKDDLQIKDKKELTTEHTPISFSDNKSLQQKKIKWVFPKGHAVRLAEVCNVPEKKAHVTFTEETKQSAEFIIAVKDQSHFTLLVPEWQEGRIKEKDTVQTRFKAFLEKCFSCSVHHVDISIDNTLRSWKKYLFVKQLLVPLKEVLQSRHPCVCVCINSKYHNICEDILKACRDAFFGGNVGQQNSKRVTVTIEKGNLAETKADIIVNSIDGSGDLRYGAISASILKIAGQKLQDELKTKYRTNAPWEIFQTTSYLKSCYHIFHGCLTHYEGPEHAKKLERFVLDCLKRSSELKAETIAFPALGAGNLGYPIPCVINAMFSAVESFIEEFGGRTTLTEVKFTLFDEDAFKLFRIEQKRRDMPSFDMTNGLKFGKVTLRAEKRSINEIDSDCILFLKEKSGYETRSGNFTTSVHTKPKMEFVSVDMNDRQSVELALKNKLRSVLPGGKKKLVAVYFDSEHPFLKLKDNLDLIFGAVADISPVVVQNTDVSVVFDGPYFEKARQFFAENSSSANNGQEATTDRILIQVVGLQNDVSVAVEKLRKQKGVHLAEISSVQDASETYKESVVETSDAVETKCSDPGLSAVKKDPLPQWKGDMLQDVKSLECYVEMQNIKDGETSDSLMLIFFKLRLEVVNPTLVYCDGSHKAILICSSKEDADYLSKNKDTTFRFKRMQKKCLSDMIFKPDARVWSIAKRNMNFMNKLEEIHVEVIDGDIPVIKAATSYQIECARAMLAEFDTKEVTKVSKEQGRKKGDSFVSYEKVVLEKVSSDVWSIVSEEAKADIELFEKDFGKFEYSPKEMTLTIPVYDVDIASEVVEKVKNRIENLKLKEFMEIPLDMKRVKDNLKDKFPGRCKDIENAIGYPCLVLLNEGKKLLAFAESYDKLMAIKHQVLIKFELTKPTARGRSRAATDTQENGNGTSAGMSPQISDHVSEKGNRKKLSLGSLEHHEKYRLYNIDVHVYQADILELPVECIVNAANENLQHGGGVAAVIARAAGKRLTEEGNQFIEENGPLRVGHACTTTAGKLNYKYVIHTVGPRWTNYNPHMEKDVQKLENDLYDAIYACFLEAEKYHLMTVAIPAVSSAIFGVPAEICVNQYARATIEYCKKVQYSQKALSEIHFIDLNLDIVKKIQDIFNILVKDGKQSPYNRQKYVKKASRRFLSEEGSTEPDAVRLPRLPELLYYEEKWRRIVFCALQECKVKIIYKQDIFEEDASAIVVSINKEGKGGALCQTVLNKMPVNGSKTVNYELKKRLGYSAKVGQVEVFDGYSCGYPVILFVVFPHLKSKGQRSDELMHAYRNVLTTANRTPRIKSVVTTLFGIDQRKDEELELAAQAFLSSYISYCETVDNEKAHFDVKIICNTEHAHDVVCSIFERYVQLQKSEENADRTENPSEEKQTLENEPKGFEEETCVICMDKITDPKMLKCGHTFCTDCIEQQFKFKQQCPTCFSVCGEITGDQPGGSMTVDRRLYVNLKGYHEKGTIAMTYNFPNGVQKDNHPNPGKFYKGITRTAYLPDNEEGRKIAAMLKLAFKRKLVFTIGNSRTTGQEGVITWNDIHHKTDLRPHSQFGYPDPTYLDRVKEELAAKGITEKDVASKDLSSLIETLNVD